MNSFSKENLQKNGVFERVKSTIEVPVFSLTSLLAEYPQIKSVDYLNIDTEGFEMEILAGLDFILIAPKVISIEQNDVLSFADVMNSTTCKFLAEKGYTPFAKNIILTN